MTRLSPDVTNFIAWLRQQNSIVLGNVEDPLEFILSILEEEDQYSLQHYKELVRQRLMGSN